MSSSANTVTFPGINPLRVIFLSSTLFSNERTTAAMVSQMLYSAGFISNSPLSSLDISSILLVSLARRPISSLTTARYLSWLSGGIVPSLIPSTNPFMLVIGVLSSWATLAMKLERDFSFLSTKSAIRLKVRAILAISSSPSTASLTEKSPRAKRRAASFIALRGSVIFSVTTTVTHPDTISMTRALIRKIARRVSIKSDTPEDSDSANT